MTSQAARFTMKTWRAEWSRLVNTIHVMSIPLHITATTTTARKHNPATSENSALRSCPKNSGRTWVLLADVKFLITDISFGWLSFFNPTNHIRFRSILFITRAKNALHQSSRNSWFVRQIIPFLVRMKHATGVEMSLVLSPERKSWSIKVSTYFRMAEVRRKKRVFIFHSCSYKDSPLLPTQAVCVCVCVYQHAKLILNFHLKNVYFR